MAYNSSYTGSQIDATVGTVQEMQNTPYLKANTGTSAYELPYSGAEISTKLAAIKTQSEIQSMINAAISTNNVVQSATVTGNGITGYVYKFGRVVYFTVNSTATSAALAANATIFTIPAAYYPIRTVEMLDTINNSSHLRCRVLSNGQFQYVTALAASYNVRVSACWISAS